MPRKQTLIALATLAIGVAAATSAHAACLSDVRVAEMAAHCAARTPAANPEGLSDADGACTRAKLPLLPPKPGLKVQANYQGLPGAAPVRVTFE